MNYWIIVDDHHEGPYEGQRLVENGLTPETLVWTEGLADWTPAGEIAELASMIEHRGVSIPHLPEEDKEKTAPAAPVCEPAATESEPAVDEPMAETVIENEQPAEPEAAGEPCMPTPSETISAASAPEPEVMPQAAACTVQVEPCPPAYIAWAIIATVLCCTVVGIPAIVFASMTKSAYYRGDIEKSKRYSELAQWFIIASVVLGCVSWPFQIAFMGIM